ncbi:MAG: type 4a pilus biogenesis protein PilO [bacterium]|jgi:type IV pilus assembly protein PilO
MAIDAETIANLSPRKKVLLFILVAGLIVGLYWHLVYRSKARQLNKLQGQYSSKQAKLNENAAIARNLPRFKAEVDKLNGKLKLVVRELPNSREIPNLLQTLNNLSAINGLEVIFIKPRRDVDKGFFAEVPIQIKVRGGYHEVGMFLDSVSKLPRIINISDITLGNPKSDNSGGIVLDVSALATTYRYIEKGG